MANPPQIEWLDELERLLRTSREAPDGLDRLLALNQAKKLADRARTLASKLSPKAYKRLARARARLTEFL